MDSHIAGRTRRALLLSFTVALLSAGAASAASHLVNSTDDDPDINVGDGVCYTGQFVFFGMFGTNECTLRAAIQESNALAGADAITFSSLIPLDGFGTIQVIPASPLPSITTNVTIDGSTIPEYDDADPWAHPIVYVNGVSAGPGSGLVYAGAGTAGSLLRAIGVMNWGSHGVYGPGAEEVTIEGCDVGLFKGILDQGNGSNGIYLLGDRNLVGRDCTPGVGCSGAKGNVASGNGNWGVSLFGGENVVGGNRIGTDSAGLLARPNDAGGVFVGGSQAVIGPIADAGGGAWEGAGNLISGNTGPGIRIVNVSTQVHANLVGTDESGSVALPNSGDGIAVEDNPNLIGNVVGLGNVVSGNGGHGIFVDDTFSAAVLTIQGNTIGVDRSLTLPLGNDADGIRVAEATRVDVEDGNVIGANTGDGIHLRQLADGNVVTENYIGTNASGADLGNGGHGVWIQSGSDDNEIGSRLGVAGSDLGLLANVIAWNGGAGVALRMATVRNAIRGNVFHDNLQPAIDLNDDGPTANDPNDGDGGSNRLQNHPEVDAAETGWNAGTSQLDVRYRVDSNVVNAVYPLVVDFHVSDAVGSGDLWVGTDTIPSIEATAWRTASFTPPGGVTIVGEQLVGTATDSEGAITGNTSEYSTPILLPEPGVPLALVAGVALLLSLRRARGGITRPR